MTTTVTPIVPGGAQAAGDPPAPAPRLTRAAVLTAPRTRFEVRDVRLAAPRPDEALVRVVATGVCHTDVAVWAGGLPFALPGVIGHEGAGVVEQVGADVTDVSPGDQVLISFSSCGACDACGDDHPAYCATWLHRNVLAGARPDGTSPLSEGDTPLGAHFFGQSSFAEHLVVQARQLVVVGPGADLTMLAPLGCGVMTGFGSVWNVLDPRPGARLAVFGTGAVGLSAVVAAAQRDPELLVAVDLVPERLELALDLGATHALHARADDVPARLAEIVGGRGLTGALDTTGDPRAARIALDALGLRGELVVCGAPPPGTEIPVDIQPMLGGKVLRGVTMGDADPRRLLPRIVELVENGTLPLNRLVRHYPLEDLDRAFADMHHTRTVKPVVVL
ncbi:NAD(P)-dependent alcohol dehydrogenase [Cellulomonas sp. S1-8]|uniref:NAD(P)-dependent alcohol dehydrogenase n=1 Tax=Cellulomonas sp. S1-8 TaxID=2904790 RepID=UPI002244F083|nr:NAD(P)-dependent alcohol dehydrogenase [Cellulomonas sp. S1-8]UZN04446.1 NAD(P)-dependent alcohol dehydrogenase [Cellulomonas sp. S1-8]